MENISHSTQQEGRATRCVLADGTRHSAPADPLPCQPRPPHQGVTSEATAEPRPHSPQTLRPQPTPHGTRCPQQMPFSFWSAIESTGLWRQEGEPGMVLMGRVQRGGRQRRVPQGEARVSGGLVRASQSGGRGSGTSPEGAGSRKLTVPRPWQERASPEAGQPRQAMCSPPTWGSRRWQHNTVYVHRPQASSLLREPRRPPPGPGQSRVHEGVNGGVSICSQSSQLSGWEGTCSA